VHGFEGRISDLEALGSTMVRASSGGHESVLLIRLIAILSIVLTLPFSGLASAASVRPCGPTGLTSIGAQQGAACCGERRNPCDSQSKSCLGMTGSCAQGYGQVQAIDRAPIRLPALASARNRVGDPVARLLPTTVPNGQWRPPRTP